mmetsp:Transcript_5191/g.8199  ORF Transcript_5191/g.8199 Transcript_5191/m.8199 type:complete len:294 (-) Transcript_5191:162-1043(-)
MHQIPGSHTARGIHADEQGRQTEFHHLILRHLVRFPLAFDGAGEVGGLLHLVQLIAIVPLDEIVQFFQPDLPHDIPFLLEITVHGRFVPRQEPGHEILAGVHVHRVGLLEDAQGSAHESFVLRIFRPHFRIVRDHRRRRSHLRTEHEGAEHVEGRVVQVLVHIPRMRRSRSAGLLRRRDNPRQEPFRGLWIEHARLQERSLSLPSVASVEETVIVLLPVVVARDVFLAYHGRAGFPHGATPCPHLFDDAGRSIAFASYDLDHFVWIEDGVHRTVQPGAEAWCSKRYKLPELFP